MLDLPLWPLLLAGCFPGLWSDLSPDEAVDTWWPDEAADHTAYRVQHEGGVITEVAGLSFRDDHVAYVGMFEMACAVDPQGLILWDYDPNEALAETVRDGDEEVIVVTTGEQVDVLDATHGGVLVDHVIPGLLVVTADGEGDVIALADDPELGCVVVLFREGTRYVVPLDRPNCPTASAFAVDREARTAWVADEEGVVAVSEAGVKPVPGVRGEVLAFDATERLLYAGRLGRRTVRAYERDGRERGEVDSGGLLVALHDAGRRIGVVARVQDRDDMTRLVHLRVGVASEVLLDVHEPVGEVVISRDGTRVGVVTDGRADFFWWSR